MKQKLAYMSIGVIFTVILSFTWLSFASQNSEVIGNPTVIDHEQNKIQLSDGHKSWDFKLEPNSIIYKNNKQASLSSLSLDDEVKVLLSSSNKVRYVVAASHKETASSNPEQHTVKVDYENSEMDSTMNRVDTPSSHSIGIRELELEVKFGSQIKIELEYENEDGEIETEWKVKDKKGNENHHLSPTETVESLIQQMGLTPEMDQQEMIERVIETLNIDQQMKKIELEITFENGKEVEIEVENKGKQKVQYKEKYSDNDNN